MDKSLSLKLNIALLIALILSLVTYYLKLFPFMTENTLIVIVGTFATIPVVLSALKAVRHRKVTVDLLASIALFVSLLNREWASVVFINLMITSARIFGDYTEGKAHDAIKSLLKLRPEIVKIKKEGGIVQEPVEHVNVGDLVVVETGDRIPIDGIIVEGDASIDQSSLTGESIPVTKTKGHKVLSSTLCLTGSLIVKTEKVGKDTTFEKIVALVESAQGGKLGIQTVADKFATVYILITLFGSIAVYLLTSNLSIVLSVLLVACADDIAVAIPLAFWSAIAKGARQGIIIKGGSFIEGLAKVNTIIVDKTGTLTKGIVKTEKIITFGKLKSHEALSIFASIESVSEHPIAKAITQHAKNDGVPIKTPQNFKEVAGKGIVATYNGSKVVVGSQRFVSEEKVEVTQDQIKTAQDYQKDGYDVVFLGIKGKLAAFLTLADQIRPDAKSTIAKLKTLGVKDIIMLTGDNENVASRVAREVGITTFHANLLPQDKLKYVKTYLSKKGKLAMVGDGVNDAASLALADIGIAMGAIGSDAAIEAADIALMQDNFSKVAEAIKLGRYTTNISKQNFLIWGIVNTIGLTLVLTSQMGPQGAAAYNFVTDFFPILNSFRVLRYKILA
ncbi:MAG TPA: cation-translocating P-type ATPase [Patescibacteria group bacterium]